MQWYRTSDTELAFVNDVNAKKNPFEELRYTATSTQRSLVYRYICKDDMSSFDKDRVKQQAKIIYGIDLNNEAYLFDNMVDDFLTEVKDMNENTAYVPGIDIGNGTYVAIGALDKDGEKYVSVKIIYGVQLDENGLAVHMQQ
jgi:hypothetical protein